MNIEKINRIIFHFYKMEKIGRIMTLCDLKDDIYQVKFQPFSYPSNLLKNLDDIYKIIKMVYPSDKIWSVLNIVNQYYLYDKINIKQEEKPRIILL